VLAAILTGVVAVQVEVLKDGARYGRSINMTNSLESANQVLRLDIARLSDPKRIEQLAAGYGMVMSGPANVAFADAARRGLVGRALRGIKPPNPAAFLTTLSAQTPGAASAVPPGQAGTALGPASSAGGATVLANGTTGAPAGPTASSATGSGSGTPTSTAPLQLSTSPPVAGPTMGQTTGTAPAGTTSGTPTPPTTTTVSQGNAAPTTGAPAAPASGGAAPSPGAGG